MTDRRTFTIKMKQTVANRELVEKYEELVEVDREIDKVGADKAAQMSDFNQELKGLRQKRKGLLDVINDGEQEVEVLCYTKVDEQLHQVVTYRCDNDEPIPELTRALTAAERQMNLEDYEAPPQVDESGDDQDSETEVDDEDEEDLQDEGELEETEPAA